MINYWGTSSTKMVKIYILTLQEGRFYVGKTNNPNFRIEQHLSGKGAEWCKKYPVLSWEVLDGDFDDFDEDKKTKELMLKKGIPFVRGGSHCQVELSAETILFLEQELNGATDACYKCGEKGHFIKTCPLNVCERCGRSSHTKNKCYAKTHLNGSLLEPRHSSKSVKTCGRCGRSSHSKNKCYAKTHLDGSLLEEPSVISPTETKYSPGVVKTCKRCGSDTHYGSKCYATTHVDGSSLFWDKDVTLHLTIPKPEVAKDSICVVT